jgi:hypothetical protein
LEDRHEIQAAAAAGFAHEHQSPAAGIAWDKAKVYECYERTDGWDKGMVDRNVLTKYQATVTNYSVSDPQSIMLYAIPASLTLDGFQTKWNTQLSDTDSEYAGNWCPHLPSPQDANGTLRTGDRDDKIPFNVEYGITATKSTSAGSGTEPAARGIADPTSCSRSDLAQGR